LRSSGAPWPALVLLSYAKRISMKVYFVMALALLSLSSFAQRNDNVIVCEAKEDIETFSVILRKMPLSTSYQSYVEDKMVGPGGRYVRSHTARPSLSLNPAQCLLQVKSTNFSISSMKMTYTLKLNAEAPQLVFDENPEIGLSQGNVDFPCRFSDPTFLQKLKDQCQAHISLDGFIALDEHLELNQKGIADHMAVKEIGSSQNGAGSSKVLGQ
jgi:hypothetical protein